MDRREEILKIFPRDLRQIFSRIPVGFDYPPEGRTARFYGIRRKGICGRSVRGAA